MTNQTTCIRISINKSSSDQSSHRYFSFSPNKRNKSSPDFIPIDIFLDVIDVSSQGLQDKNDISRIYEKYGQSEILKVNSSWQHYFYFNEKC